MAWESEADARDHARREAQARHSPSPGEPAGTCWPRRRGHRRGRRGLLLERREGGRAGLGAAPRALGQRGAAPRTQRVDAQRTRRDEDGDRQIEADSSPGFIQRASPGSSRYARVHAHLHARTRVRAREGRTCGVFRVEAPVLWDALTRTAIPLTFAGHSRAPGQPAGSPRALRAGAALPEGGVAGAGTGRSGPLRLRERVGCGAAAGFGSEAWTRHGRRPLTRGAHLAPPLRLSLRPPCVSHQPPETPPYIAAPATARLPRACAGVCSGLTHVRICLNPSLCAQMSPCQNSLHPVY